MSFNIIHKKIIPCETFAPLKFLSCDPFILYNSFVIVIFEFDKLEDDFIKINPNFSIKSAACFKSIILCLDFDHKLHCVTPHPKTKWKQTSSKVLLSDISNFCIFDDLFVFRRVVDQLILVQYTFDSNSFKSVKKSFLKTENISLRGFEIFPCSALSFSSHFREKIFQDSVEDSDKLFFLCANSRLFWTKSNSDGFRNESRVILLFEAVLPISKVFSLQNEIIISLKCGTLIFMSNKETVFLNDSIENIAEITEDLFAYTAKGNLYSVNISKCSIINMKDYKLGNICHFIVDSERRMIISITDNNLLYFTSSDRDQSANEKLEGDMFLEFPKEVENTRNIVDKIKEEVMKCETFIDKITIEKHLILLSMLMLNLTVFEKTATIDARILDDVPDNFHSSILFEPYADLFDKATSRVHVDVDFSLEFKVRFNEINRVLLKSKSDCNSAWSININFESATFNKQVSYQIPNLNNLNFIIAVKNTDLVLPVQIRAYLTIAYLDCYVVLSTAYKTLNVFDIASNKPDVTKRLEEDIVSLAERNVGLLYVFDQGSPGKDQSFRLALHPALLQADDNFLKYFPEKFKMDHRVEDLLKGSFPLTCYVGRSAFSLEMIKDEIESAYLNVSSNDQVLLAELRKFMLNIINTDNADDRLKLLDDAKYERFENVLRDLNEESFKMNVD